VSVCHNLAHLLPRDSARHVWYSSDVEIAPMPALRAERRDYFGNRMTFFAMQEPHRELNVLSRGHVDVAPAPPIPLFSSLPWEQVRDRISDAAMVRSNSEFLDAFQYVFRSPYVQWNGDIAAYAAESFTPGRPTIDAVLDLTARIHEDFLYDPKSTTVTTTLPEIMKARAGVCQDFAHFEVGCLRAMGLPARYVSGYLLTTPPPGTPRLVGADASHAWASVYVPDTGWLDVDPTNNLLPSDKHITLAWGRDFGDVSPLRGVILGGGRHKIDVSVDVTPVG